MCTLARPVRVAARFPWNPVTAWSIRRFKSAANPFSAGLPDINDSAIVLPRSFQTLPFQNTIVRRPSACRSAPDHHQTRRRNDGNPEEGESNDPLLSFVHPNPHNAGCPILARLHRARVGNHESKWHPVLPLSPFTATPDAPDLDSETWESTNLNAGNVILSLERGKAQTLTPGSGTRTSHADFFRSRTSLQCCPPEPAIPRPPERHAMHWSKWSWLAFAGGIVVALVAWILFAPDIRALGR